MAGVGDNITAAKKNAFQKIEAVLSGPWDPFILLHAGWLMIVARSPQETPYQWGYKLINSSELSSQIIYLQINWQTRDEAIRAGARHLAQNSGTYKGLEFWLTQSEKLELDQYFAWQAAYAKAKALGKSDEECRRYANTI